MTLVKDGQKPKNTNQLIKEKRNTELGAYNTKQIFSFLIYRHRVGLLAFAATAQPVIALAAFIFANTH